jgi:LacI family transcriptional regulator
MASPGSAGDGESEAGFREAFATDAGLHAAPIIAHHDGTPGSIRHSLQRLLGLRPAPTAFLVARTMPALMTASELVRRELRIPGDVAVISRDSDHFLEYFSPHLAHYTADPDGYARRLAGFIARLARGAPCRAKAVRIMPQFVAGESLESAAWSER